MMSSLDQAGEEAEHPCGSELKKPVAKTATKIACNFRAFWFNHLSCRDKDDVNPETLPPGASFALLGAGPLLTSYCANSGT